MNDIIVDCLGHRWAMFYKHNISIDQLTSIQTLEQSISTVNQQLVITGQNLLTWSAGMQDEVARLMRVNWMYQNLQREPVRKPILTHYQNNKFLVDCGDTRLMSLRLHDSCSTVGVLVTCALDELCLFRDWTRIYNSQQLVEITGFDKQTYQVFATPAKDWCFYWMEIGDHTTTHHLHDTMQRLDMIQNYINQQPTNFKFTKEWFKILIDWARYQPN
jgi:hypothetical protein